MNVIRAYFHAGLTIISDPLPFTVGQNAVLTCSSDTGVVDHIQWVSRNGVVLASDTSVQQLQLMLRPVNDSLSVHTSNFTCSVTRDEGKFNQTISSQRLPVTVTSRCLLTHTYMCSQTHSLTSTTSKRSHIYTLTSVTLTYPPHSQPIVMCIYNTPQPLTHRTTILTYTPQLALAHHHSMHSHTTTACNHTSP